MIKDSVFFKNSGGEKMYPVCSIESIVDASTGKSLNDVLDDKQNKLKEGNAISMSVDGTIDVIPSDLCGFGLVEGADGTLNIDTEYVPRMYDFNKLVERVEALEAKLGNSNTKQN